MQVNLDLSTQQFFQNSLGYFGQILFLQLTSGLHLAPWPLYVMVPWACFSNFLVIAFFKAPEGAIADFCLVIGYLIIEQVSDNQWP